MGIYKEDTKKFNFYTRNSIKCKCGHTNFLGSRDKIICSWCNRYVFKDKKTEFKYKIINEIKRGKYNERNLEIY